MSADGSVSGMFLLSSNAIEAVLTETSVSLRVVGGMLDMYFFAGPTPAAFMEQYTRVIGRPRMPPFWSLGFHQCKSVLSSMPHDSRSLVMHHTALAALAFCI